jgi:cytoskeletal protein CcmA (bactofilin family)
MGWFEKKPGSKEETTTRPPEMQRSEPSATPAPAFERTVAPPSAEPAASEPEAPRGLAALFGAGARAAEPSSSALPSGIPLGSDGASVFAESAEIEGSLEGDGDVVLRGQVRGSINITGTLIVTETGRVHADVAAREVVCGGTVEGNIRATDKVRVQGTGLVQGDIDSPSIVIDDGGGVEGFVQMEPPGGDDARDEEPLPRALPAAGRIVRPQARQAEQSHPAMAPAAAEGAPRLTREMLLGLDVDRTGRAPAAGLLNRPATAPSAAPAGAPLGMPVHGATPGNGSPFGGASASDDPFADDAGNGGAHAGDVDDDLLGTTAVEPPAGRPIPDL